MSWKPRTLTLTAAGVGLALTALVAISAAVPLAIESPTTHVALDTAEAMIAMLASYLVFGRFRESLDRTDLLLVYSLLVFAATNLVFSAIERAGAAPDAGTLFGWTTLAGRVVGAVALALSAILPVRTVRHPKGAGSLVVAVTGMSILGIAALGLALQDILPRIVRISPTAGGSPQIEVNPAVPVVQVLLLAVFVVAAIGFTRKAGESKDGLMAWLGAGSALGAVARLSYFLVPSIYTDYVYTGDLMRLAFYLLVFWGSTREIRKYWTTLEARVVELHELDAMKNTLIAGVSHDLKNPIAAVMGTAMTLEQVGDKIPPEDRADLLHRISVRARSLSHIVDDLLDLERAGGGLLRASRSPTDIGGLVQEVIAEIDDLDPDSIIVDEAHLTASVDRSRVERILDNLIRNAKKHGGSGSRIWIRWWKEQGGITIAVEDEGAGVPAELRDAIFMPFARGSDAEVPGSGVGLSVVALFAELHGGRAWVEDRPGGGASFRVFLPEQDL